MNDAFFAVIGHPLVLALCGLALHFLKEMKRIRAESGRLIGPKEYFMQYPYQTTISMVSMFVALAVLHDANNLTTVTALGAGYISDSLADVIGKRALEKI